MGSGAMLLFTRSGFKFLTHVGSKTSQFEIVVKSYARFNTQFRVKESFNFYSLQKLRTLCDNSRNSLVTKTTLNFSGPYRRVRTAKLANQSACTNREIYRGYYTVARRYEFYVRVARTRRES